MKMQTRQPRRINSARSRKRVAHALQELTHVELIRSLSDHEPAYIFKHALVQDTALSTLLRGEYRRLHQSVAHALENIHASRLDEYAAQLALHYAQAEDDAKAFEYSIRAGDIAARVSANPEALAHYRRAIEIAKHLTVPNEQLVHVYRQSGRILEVTGKYQQAAAHYLELRDLALARRDRSLELAYLMLRAPLHSAPMPTFDADLAKQLLLDALGTARELRDEIAEARILWNLSLLSVHTLQPAEGLRYGELSLELCEKLKLREQKAYTLHDLFIPYRAVGNIPRARAVQAEARELFRALDDQAMLADNLGMSAQMTMYEGDLARALEFAREGISVSRHVGNLFGIYFNQSFLTMIHIERGEFADALEAIGEQVAALESDSYGLNGAWLTAVLAFFYAHIGAFEASARMERIARDPRWQPVPPIFRGGLYALWARTRILCGDLETAAQDLASAVSDMNMGDAVQPGVIQVPLAQAELALCQNQFAAALDVLKPQAEFARKNEYGLLLPENFYLQARAHIGRGEWNYAEAQLHDARTLAQGMGARRILWQIYAASSELESARGNLAQADAYRKQACEVIQFVVEQMPAELRESFLNLPGVRGVIA